MSALLCWKGRYWQEVDISALLPSNAETLMIGTLFGFKGQGFLILKQNSEKWMLSQ